MEVYRCSICHPPNAGITSRPGIGSHVLNEVSRVWRCRGSKYTPPFPQCLHLQSILNDQGRTLLAYLLRNMSLSKQARKRTFHESWEEKYCCCAQDDNVACLLCSIVQKAFINVTSSDIMILYSVASPPLTLPTYPLSHYVMCIAGCVVRRHSEATLSTWLPMPAISSGFQMTDNNTFLAISPADLMTEQQKQLIMIVKFYVCHSVSCFLCELLLTLRYT